jgi:IclR family transcriptional regulator, mhp operon transcriptional activator
MESTRPIRALLRGLDALTVLNLRNGATVSEVAGEIRLPRTTTYRILETLCHAGYVFRDPSDDRYRLTSTVRGLSDGFDAEAWLVQIANPPLQALAGELGVPVAIATLSGTSMRVHEVAVPSDARLQDYYSSGFRVPLMTTASGLAYLAHCPQTLRASLLDLLSRSNREEDRLARDRAAIEGLIGQVRERGYGTGTQTRRVSDEVSIAVPLQAGERVLACLAARLASSAQSVEQAAGRFLAPLRSAAETIRARFVQDVAAAAPNYNAPAGGISLRRSEEQSSR